MTRLPSVTGVAEQYGLVPCVGSFSLYSTPSCQSSLPPERRQHLTGRAGAVVGRLGDEDAVTPNYRGRIAPLGQRDLPADVLLCAPLERRIRLGRVAVAVRAAPRGPVVGERRRGEAEECAEGWQKAGHG